MLHKISVLLVTVVTLVTIVSCGLVDYEFDEVLQDRYHMQLDHDTLYIMEGDTFALSPIYTPYLSNGDVFWAVDDSILCVNDNNIIANRVGESYVTAYSSVQSLKDSCYVRVMPKWECSPYDYPDEMIVNARVLVNGAFFDPSRMQIAAFVGDECRGVGVVKTYGDNKFVQFRISGVLNMNDDIEIVRFRLYIRDMLVCTYFPLKMLFDGETHGTIEEFKYFIFEDEAYMKEHPTEYSLE